MTGKRDKRASARLLRNPCRFHFVQLSLLGPCTIPCLIQRVPPALYRSNGQKRSTALRLSPVLIFFIWYISYALETEVGLPTCVFTSAALQFPALCGVSGAFANQKISLSVSLSKAFLLVVFIIFRYLSNALCKCDRMTFFFAATCNTDELPFWLIPLLRTQSGLCSILWAIAV